MRLFRSKSSFWERHKSKFLLSSVLVLGVLGWAVWERAEQLALRRLEKLHPAAQSSQVTEPSRGVPPSAAPTVSVTEQSALDTPSQVTHALERWSRAWTAQDVPTYLAMYGSQFVPPEGKSRAQWESERNQRIVGKKKIQHSFSNLSVSVVGPKATTKFVQIYEADSIQLKQNKMISWQRDEGQWRIVSEAIAP